jgi:hypothetical protein
MKRKNKKKVKQKRSSPAGTKLWMRMYKAQLRAKTRENRILMNSGKATQPGTLQGGRPLPWNHGFTA